MFECNKNSPITRRVSYLFLQPYFCGGASAIFCGELFPDLSLVEKTAKAIKPRVITVYRKGTCMPSHGKTTQFKIVGRVIAYNPTL